MTTAAAPAASISVQAATPVAPPPSPEQLQLRDKFQEFAAGTFYKQMLKALRSTQREPAYFHGGMGERMFQGQLDEQITDALAQSHGNSFADPLFAAYSRK